MFQSPSLDRKLTVDENLAQQAALYGLARDAARERVDELLEAFGIADRRRDYVEKLSGGLSRRVELAKAMLPWRAQSVQRSFERAIARTGDVQLALRELDLLEARLVSKDACKVWGETHPSAHLDTVTSEQRQAP